MRLLTSAEEIQVKFGYEKEGAILTIEDREDLRKEEVRKGMETIFRKNCETGKVYDFKKKQIKRIYLK